MKEYDYYIDHYEVCHPVRLYDDGKPMVTQTDVFDTEEATVEFARQRLAAGYPPVAVRRVQYITGWSD